MIVAMLSTVDNPHSPFDEWTQWFEFDTRSGYNSLGLLARLANVSEELSEFDYTAAINLAIDEIVRENVSGVHIKVERDLDVS